MNKPLSEKTTRLHNTGNLIQFLQCHPPFNQMDRKELSILIESSDLAFYSQGETIVGPTSGQTDSLFIVKKGLVEGQRQEEGQANPHTAISLLPGECFPIAALIGERATRTTHIAAEDTFCFIVPKKYFIEVFSNSAIFRDFALRGASSLLDQANKQMKAKASENLNEGYSLDTPLADFTRHNPIVCPPDTPINKVVEKMHQRNIGSMIATDEHRHPIGIFTLRDLRKVVAEGNHGLNEALSQVMTHHPKTLPIESTAFDAALLMAKHHFSHICLVDEQNKLVGVISERDIFSLQRVNLVHLTRALDNAASFSAINTIREDIPGLINNMLAHGASVLQVNRITTLLNDYTAKRIIALTRQTYSDPLPHFTWLSFGSEARMEQTLVTDQDNGILFQCENRQDLESTRQSLLRFAKQVNEKMDQCGFPLCKGNIMASNPDLCLSLNEWKEKFSQLVATATPENLLHSTILFDLRAIGGDEQAVSELRIHLLEKIANNTLFQKMLTASALQNRPPLNLFQRFVTKKQGDSRTIDLKTQGISPFIEGIRILALANKVTSSNTMDRLNKLVELDQVNKKDAGAWREAYSFIQATRMKHHYEQVKSNIPADNHLDPNKLNPLDQRVLKEAFRQAQRLQKKLELRYQL